MIMFGLTSLPGLVPGALARGSDDSPLAVGVVATVSALDAARDMATLRTQEGERLELPQRGQWHVGHQVLCDQIGQPLGSRSRFQNGRIWESAREHESPAPNKPASRR